MSHSALQRLVKMVRGQHGTVRRTYWVKSEQPTEATFAFRDGQRVNTVNQKVASPTDHSVIHTGFFAAHTHAELRIAMQAISKVHSVPTSLPVVPIYPTRMLPPGTYGQYTVGSRQSSGIQIANGTGHEQSTLAHEYGHYLDHHLFGSGQSGLRGLGTYRRNPELKELMNALYRSPSVKSVIAKHDENIRTGNHRHAQYSAYLLMPPEILARAYAQYIATRSGNRQMQNQIAQSRSIGERYGYRAQWSDKEFEPIAREFDNVFRRRGLLRSA